jgi:hypothetical protein
MLLLLSVSTLVLRPMPPLGKQLTLLLQKQQLVPMPMLMLMQVLLLQKLPKSMQVQ